MTKFLRNDQFFFKKKERELDGYLRDNNETKDGKNGIELPGEKAG